MGKAKIMIVEDEAIVALNMKSELSDMDYEICKLVTSGEDAVKNVEHEKPDVILMDIILNGKISGIEAAREIRSRHKIPIIFLTGCEDEGTRELAEEVDPVDYLIKPVEIYDLGLVIDKALQKA